MADAPFRTAAATQTQQKKKKKEKNEEEEEETRNNDTLENSCAQWKLEPYVSINFDSNACAVTPYQYGRV
jgi:hypothetical protein